MRLQNALLFFLILPCVGVPLAASPISGSGVVEAHFSNPTANALNSRRVVLEKKIIDHLTGKTPSKFNELLKEFNALKNDFSASQGIPPLERNALANLILRDERMLKGGSALARGASHLDSKIEGIIRAAASSSSKAPSSSVDAVVSQLVSAASAKTTAAANKVFDNLRAQLRKDPSATANLEAVKADFGKKTPIVYTAPNDPRYRLTNKAKFSKQPQAPPTTSSAATSAAKAATAEQNCEEALNGAMFSLTDLCKKTPDSLMWAPPALAGLLDTIHDQFMTLKGWLGNLAFLLMGIVLGIMTGGAGVIIKVLLALGMTAWAISQVMPLIVKAIADIVRSKKHSVEKYRAIRQLSAIIGGIAIMAILTFAGGKVSKVVPASWEAKLSGVASKTAKIVPATVSSKLANLTNAFAAKLSPPKLEGQTHIPKAPNRIAPSAIQSPEKGYVLIAEQAGAAPKTSALGRLAKKTVADYLEQEIVSGKPATPQRARELLATALEKANQTILDHAANSPEETGHVNMSVGIVARDAGGQAILVSAQTGEGGVFLRRAGDLELVSSGKAIATAEPLGSPHYTVPEISETPLKPKDVLFAASREVADATSEAHAQVSEDTPPDGYVRSLLQTERMRGLESEPRAIAELRIPKRPGLLAALADFFGTREAAYRSNVLGTLASHYLAPSSAPSLEIPSEPFVPVKNASPGSKTALSSDRAKHKGRHGNSSDNSSSGLDSGDTDGTNQDNGGSNTNSGVPPKTETANSEPIGYGGSGGAEGADPGGGSSGRHLKAPHFGGFGEKGNPGGGGGGAHGGGDGGIGGDVPFDGVSHRHHGGFSPSASEISAANPHQARPAPFASEPSDGSTRAPHDSRFGGGHESQRSLSSRFDGSSEQPRSSSEPRSAVAMKGLGGGDVWSLPHPAQNPSAAKPAAADSASNEKAPSAGARSTPLSAKPSNSQGEDYNYTYLQPARYKYDLPPRNDSGDRGWRYWLELGLQSSAALAAAYLLYHSDLAYLLGITRRRKNRGISNSI